MPLTDDQLHRLYSTVFGNGVEGLDEKMRYTERQLSAMRADLSGMRVDVSETRKQLSALNKELEDAAARRQGQRDLAKALRWALGVLVSVVTLLGAVNAVQVNTTMTKVLETLRTFPTIPE